MTTAKPTEDNLSRACAKVGRFLHEFALVEQEINNSIANILDLKGGAVDVVAHSVDFARKANLLRTVALETVHKGYVEKLFRAIFKHNDDRVLMAHSVFEPTANEGVQFKRTVARDGKITKQDPLWTKQKFDDSYKGLRDAQEKLMELGQTLRFSAYDRNRIFNRYLYTPASSYVPLAKANLERALQAQTGTKTSQLDSQPNESGTIRTKEKPAKSIG
jgi:hypothetical protein